MDHRGLDPLGDLDDAALQVLVAAEIIARLTPFIELDGFGEERTKRQLELDFGQVYGLYSSYKDTDIQLTLAAAGGETKTITVPGIDYEAYRGWRRGLMDPIFKLEFYGDNKTAYLGVGIFWNVPGKAFLDFMKEAFAEIRERKPTALIVDIRDNSGGADPYGAMLAQYLLTEPFRYFDKIEVTDNFEHDDATATAPEEGKTRVIIGEETYGIKEPISGGYNGRLFILINSETFSTGSDFAQTMRHNSDAVFLGAETSGGYFGNTSWDFENRGLPNSGLQIRIPLGLYYKSGGGEVNGRGIAPDFLINKTPEDLTTNRDRVLEKALELAAK